MKKLLYFLFFTLILSCNSQKSNLQIENGLINQIFLKVVESENFNTKICQNDEAKKQKSTLVIFEYTSFIVTNDLEKIPKDFKTLKIGDNEIKIDVKSHKSKKFDIIPLSNFPKDENYEKLTKKVNNFAGTVYFGRIFFDTKKQNAVLPVYFSCNIHSMVSYFVYLRKASENKWNIVDIKNNWIS